MIYKTLVGILILLMGCSGNQSPSKSTLKIDNGINRGINYTDPQGTDYSIRYIPITITNDSTIPIRIQIAFSKEYDYPIAYGDDIFRLFPMSTVWALDGGEITDSMLNELPKYIDNPFSDKTLEPGEKWVLGIGSLYPRPAKVSGVLPNLLFTHDDKEILSACEWLMDKDQSSNPQIPLGLKLNFHESCTIIPCGHISYPDR